jgi:hypothetical protein
MIIVKVHLYSQAVPIVIENVRNAYTKDGLYCVMLADLKTEYKFPYQHIFRIKEVDAGQDGTESR